MPPIFGNIIVWQSMISIAPCRPTWGGVQKCLIRRAFGLLEFSHPVCREQFAREHSSPLLSAQRLCQLTIRTRIQVAKCWWCHKTKQLVLRPSQPIRWRLCQRRFLVIPLFASPKRTWGLFENSCPLTFSDHQGAPRTTESLNLINILYTILNKVNKKVPVNTTDTF